MDRMDVKLKKLTDAWKRIGCPRRILIALSGGADSVALFCMLKALADNEDIVLAAVHINHGLRESAADDAAFCEMLCKKYQVPFFLKHAQLYRNSEGDARDARYALFAQVFTAWNADVLALAHHQDDQAETVLLHLFRGAGMQGLCGMKEKADMLAGDGCLTLWRPLLQMTHEELMDISLGMAGSWCQDETNQSDAYLRNFLRNRVFPLIEERVPQVKHALARTAEIFQSENELLESMTEEFISAYACAKMPVPWIKTEPFNHVHQSMKRRIMQRFLPKEATFTHINIAIDLKAGESLNLPGGNVLKNCEEYLCLISEKPFRMPLSSPYAENAHGRTGDGIRTQSMPADILKECTLRYRLPGDVIRPFGMQGTKKLQDYLTDRKLPQPMRDHLPLLCMGNRVIWAVGVGAGEEARCIGKSNAILLTYTGRLPFEP